MRAYKCDICDKLYINPTEYAEKTSPVNGVAIGFIPTNMVFTNGMAFSSKDRQLSPEYDICPDCIAFFRKLFPTMRQKGGTDWVKWPEDWTEV